MSMLFPCSLGCVLAYIEFLLLDVAVARFVASPKTQNELRRRRAMKQIYLCLGVA